ncbi:MAG: MobC family plasmid mobilization relaxosome protein [Oscillospiraceae bacterium]|jgi:hypothetical protein|nr:MobC family plasmid mobilization relaxosome protein [Oscillospiraceae bacterium]
MQLSEQKPKQNLFRNIAMTFRVTSEERDMIHRRQQETGIINRRVYLLKMALNGQIIHVELDGVRDMVRLLGNISNNINQIAKRVNETGNTYQTDIADINARIDEIWEHQRILLRRLSDVLEAVS